MGMGRRILEIVRKEFRQTLRNPRTRILLFLPPLIQLVIFGFAVNLDVEDARLGWVDLDRTPASRDLRAAFEGSRHFHITALPAGEEEAAALLNRGEVQAVVRVLPGFARDLVRGRMPAVQILVDGTDSNTAGIVANYAGQVLAAHAARAAAPRPASGITAEPRIWFNPDLNSRDYFVPGIVVNIIALVTVMLTAMSIVREKEIGTMEQLLVSPISPVELMLGKLLPFALVGLLEVALVTSAALAVFRIPFQGSALLLFAGALLFLLTTLGVGLFISTVSQTQQQAMMSSFFFFAPAFLLSGFAFPIRNMPEPVQVLTFLNPLRYFMEIVRGIFLKGIGAEVLWLQMLLMLALGSAVLAFSALRFRKRLD